MNKWIPERTCDKKDQFVIRERKKERRQKRRVKTQLKTNTCWKKENNSKMPTTEKRARFAAV